MNDCTRRCSERYSAADGLDPLRVRMVDPREQSLVSMRVATVHCYESDELSVAEHAYGFPDDDPEVEETEDLVRRDPGVPPGRLVLVTRGQASDG